MSEDDEIQEICIGLNQLYGLSTASRWVHADGEKVIKEMVKEYRGNPPKVSEISDQELMRLSRRVTWKKEHQAMDSKGMKSSR